MVRCLTFVLALVLGCHSVAFAAGAHDTPPADAQKIHDQLSRRGLGKGVKVWRRDGSEVQGVIAALNSQTVEIEPKGSARVTVLLTDITRVKSKGLSSGAKIGIGVGIGVVVTVGILAIIVKHELDKPWSLSL